MAVAYAGRALGVPVDVVVPTTTEPMMVQKITALGARVTMHGDVWDRAHAYALQLQQSTPDSVLVHPFEHETTWNGHATIIEEVAKQLAEMKESPPSAIAVAVGGGGLLIGVLRSMRAIGWNDVPVFACETFGAASFALATAGIAAPKPYPAAPLPALAGINTIAKTLGATRVAEEVVHLARHPLFPPVRSVRVTDQQARK
jgi:L-serine/L-threonine ammonia-lyase